MKGINYLVIRVLVFNTKMEKLLGLGDVFAPFKDVSTAL
jgi:hypothetical protein